MQVLHGRAFEARRVGAQLRRCRIVDDGDIDVIGIVYIDELPSLELLDDGLIVGLHRIIGLNKIVKGVVVVIVIASLSSSAASSHIIVFVVVIVIVIITITIIHIIIVPSSSVAGQPRPGQARPGQPRPGQPRPGQPRPAQEATDIFLGQAPSRSGASSGTPPCCTGTSSGSEPPQTHCNII